MSDKSDYITLIHKRLTGAISPLEAEQLDSWRLQAPENQDFFDEITQAWELSGQQKLNAVHSVNTQLERLLSRIGQADQDAEKAPTVIRLWPKLFYSRVWKYAAAALFVGVLYSGYYAWSIHDTRNIDLQVSTTSHRDVFTLPDQSMVDLNTTSSVQYQGTSNERNIEFSGEGFFQVTPNRERPFIIHTEFATIQVVGTSFNVRAIKGEDEVIVSVSSGTVKVTTKNKTQILTAGRQCRVLGKDGTLQAAPTNNQNYLSWKTREIQFENATLQDVFSQLEQTYQTGIDVKAHHLLSCRFTGSFENIELTQALEILEFSFGFQVTWNDNKTNVTITGGHCNP